MGNNEIIKNKTELPSSNIDDSHFMITFSKSTSKNFDRALYLAKSANHFYITEDKNQQEIYQAVYTPDNYLNFITLYELISNWKSTYVFKNGEMIDRKILGQINYCYGDKLRFGNNKFCFGASMFTENPFGCHRLMIHSGQRPWYRWIRHEDNRYVYIDKKAIKEQIDAKTNIYKHCPSFNYENIVDIFNELPNKIDKTSKFYKEMFHEANIVSEEQINEMRINFEERVKEIDRKGFLSKILKLTGLKK